MVSAFVLMFFAIENSMSEDPMETHQVSVNDRYSVIVTHRDVTCFQKSEIYAFCLKDGYKFACDAFSADLPYESVSEGIIRIRSENLDGNTRHITFRFKDQDKEITKAVSLNYYCFKEIRPSKVEVKQMDEMMFEITVCFEEPDALSEDVTYSVSALYGKPISAYSPEKQKLVINYLRGFKHPYIDVIALKGEQLLTYIYVTIPYSFDLQGETEPLSRVKVSTRYETLHTIADQDGRFRLKLRLLPDDEFMDIDIRDLAGNRTRERVKVSFPKHPTDFLEVIQLEGGVVVLTNRKADVAGLSRISEHVYAFFLDGPGECLVSVSGAKYRVHRKSYPAFLDVHLSGREIYADGTSEVVFSVQLKDTLGREMDDLPDVKHNLDDDSVELKRERGRIRLVVKRRKRDTAKIVLSYEFLRFITDIVLLPGPPVRIVADANRYHIRGDGKDKITIRAYVQDRAGNIIPSQFMRSDLEVHPDYGEVHLEGVDEGVYDLSYTVRSESNRQATIRLSYENISEIIKVAVLARTSFFRISQNFGLIGNFGRVLAPTAYLELSYGRLIGDRYGLFEMTIGYFQTEIGDVDFRSLHSAVGISSHLYGEKTRLGLCGFFITYIASSFTVREIITLVTPAIKFSHDVEVGIGKISLDVFLFYPKKKMGRSFITVYGPLERFLIGVGFGPEL